METYVGLAGELFADRLLPLLAQALRQPDDLFTRGWGGGAPAANTMWNPPLSLRMNYFPAAPAGGGRVIGKHAHTDSVSSVAFNSRHVPPDATGKAGQKLVAVGSYDGSLVLYDASNGEVVKVLDGPTDVEFVDFHPKGGTVALAGSIADGTVWMYHTPSAKCLQVFVGHEGGDGQGGGFLAPAGYWGRVPLGYPGAAPAAPAVTALQ